MPLLTKVNIDENYSLDIFKMTTSKYDFSYGSNPVHSNMIASVGDQYWMYWPQEPWQKHPFTVAREHSLGASY
jgi:hypothetical protein